MGNCLPLLSVMLPSPCKLKSSSNSSSSVLAGCLISNVADVYKMGEEIGRGKFGVIRRCTRKSTGEVFACKTIAKSKLQKERERESVRREVALMESIRGHPNAVRFEEALEDTAAVHLIMELCEGGDLFDRIVEKRSYSEAEAAGILNTLIGLIHYCHTKLGIMHRDLKPENILLASSSKTTTTIKLADFGLAVPFTPGQKFQGTVGSPYYIAPEILDGEYSEAIDVWSAGVILYILLSGYPPFAGHNQNQILPAVQRRKINFLKHPWPRISREAKDLIRGMLRPNASMRLTPSQILKHPWIVKHTTPIISLHLPNPDPLPLAVHSNTTTSSAFHAKKQGARINLMNHTQLSKSAWKDLPQEEEEEEEEEEEQQSPSSSLSSLSIMNTGYTNYAKAWHNHEHGKEESRQSNIIKSDALLLLSSAEREAIESAVSSMVSNSLAMHCHDSSKSSSSNHKSSATHNRHRCRRLQLAF